MPPIPTWNVNLAGERGTGGGGGGGDMLATLVNAETELNTTTNLTPADFDKMFVVKNNLQAFGNTTRVDQWELAGVTAAFSSILYNCLALYWEVVDAGGGDWTLKLWALPVNTDPLLQVAEGTRSGTGLITLSAVNSSGIAGRAFLETAEAFAVAEANYLSFSDVIIQLPAAAGNAGAMIGIRVGRGVASMAKVGGNGGFDLIDGQTPRLLHDGECAILLSDGTGWTKVAGKTIPMRTGVWLNTSLSVADNAEEQVPFDSVTHDNGMVPAGYWEDSAVKRGRLFVRRRGLYRFLGGIGFQSDAAPSTPGVVFTQASLRNSGDDELGYNYTAFYWDASTSWDFTRALYGNAAPFPGADYVYVAAWQQNPDADAANVAGGAPGLTYLEIEEQPAW